MPHVKCAASRSARDVPSADAVNASRICPSTNAAAMTTNASSERGQANASVGQRVGESGERWEVESFTTDVGVQIECEQRRGNPFAR